MNKFLHGEEVSWREPRRGTFFRTCEFCGSINPDDLAKITGWIPNLADQKYGWPHKFYIENLLNPNDLEFCMEAGSKSICPDNTEHMRYKLVKDLTDEEREICEQDGMGYSASQMNGYVGFGHRKTLFAKLYTIHLADDALSEEVKQILGAKTGYLCNFTEDGQLHWTRFDYSHKGGSDE